MAKGVLFAASTVAIARAVSVALLAGGLDGEPAALDLLVVHVLDGLLCVIVVLEFLGGDSCTMKE